MVKLAISATGSHSCIAPENYYREILYFERTLFDMKLDTQHTAVAMELLVLVVRNGGRCVCSICMNKCAPDRPGRVGYLAFVSVT